jgi:hypothetical protein
MKDAKTFAQKRAIATIEAKQAVEKKCSQLAVELKDSLATAAIEIEMKCSQLAVELKDSLATAAIEIERNQAEIEKKDKKLTDVLVTLAGFSGRLVCNRCTVQMKVPVPLASIFQDQSAEHRKIIDFTTRKARESDTIILDICPSCVAITNKADFETEMTILEYENKNAVYESTIAKYETTLKDEREKNAVYESKIAKYETTLKDEREKNAKFKEMMVMIHAVSEEGCGVEERASKRAKVQP